MRKRRWAPAIILSMLMIVQTPVMAGELLAEEAPVRGEMAADEVLIEGEIPEEAVEEEIPEAVEEDDLSEGELLEEAIEDGLIPDDIFEEEPAEAPGEAITEELTAEQTDTLPSEEEGVIEEDEPAPVGATSDYCGSYVRWTLSDAGNLTIYGTGNMWNYRDDVDDEDVYNESPFFDCGQIKSITIESGVTSIGSGIFENCTSLTSVTIPDSVKTIEDHAFDTCISLASVTIPDSVTRIGESAFLNCGSLTSVTIPGSIMSIEDNVFDTCSSLANVTIEDGVRSIGNGAFLHCSSLTGVTIPNSVTSIGNNAFSYCSNLVSVTIGDSVTSIGNDAFLDCSSLTSVTIPDSVTSIRRMTFSSCSSLTSVTIGNGVKSIESEAFSRCSSLTSVTIPGSVTSIGAGAFWNCSALTSVAIPHGVKSIGAMTFSSCSALSTIAFEGNAPQFDEIGVFEGVTANAYYPYDDPAWTAGVRQNYGGNITWIPVRRNGKTGFFDVTNPDDFFHDPIYWAVDNGIATGYSDNTFRPKNLCHRAAVVTFLWRLAGKPDEGISTAFSDMTGNDDFDRAITWAANHDITTGYDDGTFRPYIPCHRAAIVTFLWRYVGKPEPSAAAGFSDMTNNIEFDKAIAWAAENSITTGYTDGTFRPYNSCLRLAVVTFLYRMSNWGRFSTTHFCLQK